MFSVLVVIAIAAVFIAVEKIWPDQKLPQVKGWWWRVILINAVQAGMVIVGGMTWEKYFHQVNLLHLSEKISPVAQAFVAYGIMTFVYYWWHRVRHESNFLWNTLHQLHHSAARLETITSYYKHPVEIWTNSLIVSCIVYTICGADLEAAGYVNIISSVAEFFYHVNIKTPQWLGYIIQRPEMHKVHHQRGRHYYNFADLPVWDMAFGTFKNPKEFTAKCGFSNNREELFVEMLTFKNVNPSNPKTMKAKLKKEEVA
jgi:sterol desaturase/sphingolipid hydroxylase (fatty acid hydroxylase superfamily)